MADTGKEERDLSKQEALKIIRQFPRLHISASGGAIKIHGVSEEKIEDVTDALCALGAGEVARSKEFGTGKFTLCTSLECGFMVEDRLIAAGIPFIGNGGWSRGLTTG